MKSLITRGGALVALVAVSVSCSPDDGGVVTPADASADAPTDAIDAARADGAALVRAEVPSTARCGEMRTATVVMRNTGTSTWTRAAGFTLSSSGSLHPTGSRVALYEGDSVPPGGTYAFTIPLASPSLPGSYTIIWQMAHQGSGSFGDIVARDLTVSCTPDAGSMDVPSSDVPSPDVTSPDVITPDVPPTDTGSRPCPGGPTELDLHSVTLYSNPPDLADWPVTTRLTAVDFTSDGVRVEFSKRDGPDRWPDVVPPGWDGPLQYTMGIVECIDGTWYSSAVIEFWYGLAASGGNIALDNQIAMNWYYDAGRWGRLAGRQPATGETIGVFIAAGNLRNITSDDRAQSPVMERSNVVLVPMPSVAGATHRF